MSFLTGFIFCLLFCSFPALLGNGQEDCPRRIISLGPVMTEELYLLGAEDKLVGCTVYCQRPPAAKNKEKVGTIMEVNEERIAALKPDLVLLTSLAQPRTKEKLNRLGIKTVTFPAAKSFPGICGQFLELGGIVGKERYAGEIIQSAEDKIASIRKKTAGLPKPKVFVQIGARPLVAAGGDSFVNDFIEFAGGINIARGLKTAPYSREVVLEDNPDVIIIATMGIQGDAEKEAWQRYRTIKAVQSGRIYLVDSYTFCSPTPVSFAETLEEIAGLLHEKE
ncbi:MAG: ABC transporter substrate-binding protein [Candidatus Omnitrophota bacterium]